MTTDISTTTIPALMREQLAAAHALLEATMSDVTSEQARWIPPGIANPLGATYAHVVCSEDIIVQGLLQATAPLAVTDWASRTGLSEPMPTPGQEWAQYPAWTRRVQVDLVALKAYAQAVYAATDAYLARLSDADMNRELDLTALGMGHQRLASAFTLLVLNHVGTMTGEIACLKGLQGGKGYPF